MSSAAQEQSDLIRRYLQKLAVPGSTSVLGAEAV